MSTELNRESLDRLLSCDEKTPPATDLEWDVLHISGRPMTDLELAAAWILCMRSRGWEPVEE